MNAVSHPAYLPSRPQRTPCTVRLLLHGVLLAVIGMLAPTARAVQAQQPAVETLATSGEEWNYTIRSWQSQDGLPEETVQAFAQTPDGYLWVGTSGGLLRFDGAHFRLFAHENTPAFGENSVFCLLAARDGRLWIGTDGSGLIELVERRLSCLSRGEWPDRRFCPGARRGSQRPALGGHRRRIVMGQEWPPGAGRQAAGPARFQRSCGAGRPHRPHLGGRFTPLLDKRWPVLTSIRCLTMTAAIR